MDVDVIRKSFPALAGGLTRFDAPGGSLVPQQVAHAMAAAMTAGMCQRGSVAEPDRLTEATTVSARGRWADCSGRTPAGSSSAGR